MSNNYMKRYEAGEYGVWNEIVNSAPPIIPNSEPFTSRFSAYVAAFCPSAPTAPFPSHINKRDVSSPHFGRVCAFVFEYYINCGSCLEHAINQVLVGGDI
jgi:hypothetical protein